MKHVLLIITFFFCYTLSAQSERDQKIQKKVENNQSTNSSNSNSNNNSGGVSSPSNWNTNNNWNNNHLYNNRYYNPYNNPYYMLGTRNYRSRRYTRYNQNSSLNKVTKNPIKPLKLILGLGVSSSIIHNRPSTVGGRFIAGNENYYVFFGIERSQPNTYNFYDNIDMWDVFGWDDYVEDYYTSNNTYFGIAVSAGNNFYPHLSFGNVTSTRYLLCMDETLVLSSDGNYTILGETNITSTFGIGVDYKLDHVLFTSTIGFTGPNRLSLGVNLTL